MALCFMQQAGQAGFTTGSGDIKRVTLCDKDGVRNDSMAYAIQLAAYTAKIGGQPRPLNLGLLNYYWKADNPNILILKDQIGQGGIKATIEFADAKRLTDEQLVIFMKCVSSESTYEVSPKTYGPQQPSL